jgi:serine protease
MMREGTDDEVVERACKVSAGCEQVGHPSSGDIPHFEIFGTEEDLEAVLLQAEGLVEFVEPDVEVFVDPLEEMPATDESDPIGIASTSWGLRRVGAPGANNGEGAHIYVFDTGLRYSHNEFRGRAIAAADWTSGSLVECRGNTNCARDRHSHGSHCGGTAGGSNYGVASRAKLYSIKVLGDNGNGRNSWSIGGLGWVASKAKRPAVATISIQGRPASSSYASAVQNAVNKGIVVVVCAGNYNENACGTTPAHAAAAITVGSTTSTDARSSFSNFGSCVNIWAPGSSISSAGAGSDSEIKRMSGTSMATPHVAGAAAVLLTSRPSSSPATIRSRLLSAAQTGAISGLKSGDKNLMLKVAR